MFMFWRQDEKERELERVPAKISEGTQQAVAISRFQTECMPWFLIPTKYALGTLNTSTGDVIMSAARPSGIWQQLLQGNFSTTTTKLWLFL